MISCFITFQANREVTPLEKLYCQLVLAEVPCRSVLAGLGTDVVPGMKQSSNKLQRSDVLQCIYMRISNASHAVHRYGKPSAVPTADSVP